MRETKETGGRFKESHASTLFSTRLSLSTFVLRRKLMGIWIYMAYILLFTTALSTEGFTKEIGRSGKEKSSLTHSCYICLPPDKKAVGAKTVLAPLSHETQQQILHCVTFALNLSTDFILPCPPKYMGCLIQIHGANKSRFCARFLLNDCKQANEGELCCCIICNANRLHHSLITTKSEKESRKFWQSNETDDEDLLQESYHHLDRMQDDIGDVGSGEWEPPPGVILLEKTTPKPTLIPNLRPDSRTTTSISSSGVDNFSISLVLWLVLSVILVVVY